MPPQPKRLCDLPAHRDSKRNRPDNDGSVMDRPIEKPTMQGKKDIFSTLPDDCLFLVLSFLDRDSLDIMEGVSKKMYCVTRHEGCRKCKREVMELTLVKPWSGDLHSVRMETLSGEFLAFIESCTTDAGFKGRFSNIDDLAKFIYVNTRNGYDAKTIRDVPDCAFRAVGELLVKHVPRSLQLLDIFLDESFLQRLETALNGRYPERICLMNVTIEASVRLKEFILGTKAFGFMIVGKLTLEQQTVFRGDFFREFALMCQAQKKCAQLKIWNNGQQVTRWRPARETLRFFVIYSELYFYALTLTLEQLIEIIWLGFGDFRERCWEFSLSGRLEWEHFREFNIAPLYVIKRSSYHPYGGLIYEIKERGSDRKCEISTGPWSGGICRVKIGFLASRSTAV